MPRRSNSFQTLIALIERQLAAEGVTVRESAELEEYPESSLREVDVLIEAEVSGHVIRIALECRDHKARQDKTWIDGLIGKYRDLQVDRVVAVSRSGFTRGALEKAHQARIEPLTFEEALEENWPEYFRRLHTRFLVQRCANMSATFEYHESAMPSLKGEPLKDALIESGEGQPDGSVEEVVMRLFRTDAKVAVKEKVQEDIYEILTGEDRQERTFDIRYDVKDRYIVDHEGMRYQLKAINLKILWELKLVDPTEEKRYIYKRNQVMVSSLDLPSAGTSATVVTIQVPNEISE